MYIMAMDLSSLPDEVLFYSNDQFFKFIENYLGVDEMNLLKLQSIKNIRTLINVPDIFSVLSMKCKELLDLKNRLCFIDDDNNNFIIKAGIKTSFDDLIIKLKEKNNKYLKRRRNSKSSTLSSTTNNPVTNTSLLNTTSSNAMDLSQTLTSTPLPNSLSINDYIHVISDSIEKYSINTFKNIILKHNSDYVIHLSQLDTGINGFIKCGCKSTIKLAFRLHTKSFQLSPYFKHIKKSRCAMVKKKRQESNKSNNSSDDILQNDMFSDSENENITEQEIIMDDLNKNSRITTNMSISNDSSSSNRKRQASSSDSTKKKKKC